MIKYAGELQLKLMLVDIKHGRLNNMSLKSHKKYCFINKNKTFEDFTIYSIR